ncbi:MAG: peptidase M13 [Actinobacteria bacterium]|nr:peptidase M13 [Actinomycetota bacterium]
MRSGLDLTHIDPSIRAQDDLFRFMNGKWLKESVIPEDRASDGAFYRLYEEAEKQVKEIILEQAASNGATGSNAQKIGDLYSSFMDEVRAESLGVSPIKGDLDKVKSIKNKKDFIKLLGDQERCGLGGLFYSFVSTDHKDSTQNIIYLGQSGLSLPDEAYYREDEYAPIRQAFLLHMERMFSLAQIEDGKAKAEQVLELEGQIASSHWDQVKDRDATLTYNKKSFAQLTKLCPEFEWQEWITTSQTPPHVLEQVVVRQPSYFEGLSKLLGNFELEKWQAWLTWHILSASAPYLNKALVDENFNFYGTTLSGIPQLKQRWKRGVALVEAALGEAVGQIYVERHFGQAAKVRMQQLVANLIQAYREDIAALTWMGAETKAKAFVKLDKFIPKIGYPDKWRDYSKLQINSDDLIGNLARIARFAAEYEFEKIGKPVDKSEWYMTPQTVNAYYNPGMNEIVFPAAILQPPFFDVLADDDAANYGGIGAVIGHEIGHGFDDQGSKYDGDGNLANWWSDADRAEFEKLTQKLITQYDQLSPTDAPDVKVNGALTIGENIGDLGGLTIAYKAYQISLAGKKAPVIDGYTGEQRFFMGWAQSWRGKYRAEEVRRRIATDPHSPDEFRCNQVVSNLDEFYQAFEVSSADKHFMPENERVRIW